MPTTTASFADFDVEPSRLSAAALAVLYLSAACLLFLAWFRAVLPFPIIALCLDMLWSEWFQRYLHCLSLRGRLVVFLSGEVSWQQQQWQLEKVKIRTRYLLLLGLCRPGQRRWLLVCRDACSESSYRALSLLCYGLTTNGGR